MYIRFILIIILLTFALSSSAQRSVSVRERITNLVKYADVTVSKDSLNIWVGWVEIGESPDQEVTIRNEAWKKFLLSFYSHQGTIPDESVTVQSLQAWSQFLTFPFLTGRILDFNNVGRNDITVSEIITKSGEGSSHILLIPPFGFSSDIFEIFKIRYKDDFIFHEVSFPQGNNAWKYPAKANYSEAEWLTKTENAVATYLQKLGDVDLLAVTTGTGTYTALKLTEKFSNIKGIVSIDGLYKSDLVDVSKGKDADKDYRKSASDRAFPTSMVIQFSQGVLARNYAFSQNSAKNQQYLNQITPENVNTILRYSQEFKAQDITSILLKSNIPILSIVSIHNDQSSQASDRSVLRLWAELKANNADIPLSIIKVPGSQSLVFIDQPELFNYYFKKFTVAPSEQISQIPTETEVTVELPSPLASESQVIESCKITIEYSQPALNGRSAFGELVPYGKVWRAGANAATTFAVSRDVLIDETHFLKAGKYSLFFIPEKEEWEVIINRIPDQWGAYNYKKDFDALRFKVKPTITDQPFEFLNYDLVRAMPDVASLKMNWANISVSFNIVQFFALPEPPVAFISALWKVLLTDEKGDGANTGMTDGKALSYLQKNDSLWFKFDLHKYNNKKAFALNILMDSDFDQKTGAAWFGQNTTFTFDKAITLWMQKSGSGFQGTHGIMSPEDFTTGNQNLAYMNNMTFFLDIDERVYIVGVPIKDLELTSKKIRVIGAVGEYQTWNDDIGDTASAVITIKN